MKKLLSIENLTFLGIILGVLTGVYFPEFATSIKFLGDIFLNLLKMIVIPLIFVSIFIAISKLSSVEELKNIGIKAFLYYLTTTSLAVITGIIVVNIFPFSLSHINPSQEVNNLSKLTLETFIQNIIPSNIFQSLAEGKALHAIVFAILFSTGVLYIQSSLKRKLIVDFFDGLNDAFLKMAKWIVALSPIGVYSLIGYVVAEKGFGTILSLWQYVLVVLIGIFWHFTVNLPSLAYFIGKFNPVKYFKQVRKALLIAFSTCSSSATLPVSIEVAEKEVGIPKKVAGFILPLGATINMDGTALYTAIASIFIANVYGIDLTFTDEILIFITATLASIGAAAIPSAGLITMTLIFSTVGIPIEGISLIIVVDRFLDMFRTATNVWGDLIGAKLISRYIN
ncbi:MAG TPA: dicarboxylate/amino acid:cation symporter [Hydrogenothermaceae bacterium]|nr:dicarboxylate/amino acid:cation symporter [Hydrogenothermaceae bacterium]